IEPGVTTRTVSLIDLFPTFASLAGLDAPADLEGRDITPILHDPDTPWDHPARVFFQEDHNEAVIDEDFRYIHYSNGDEELYDRRADPHDWDNLARDPAHADTLERYRAKRWFPQQTDSSARR
ncbi:MAG: sulfatase/phosphatase domain-containing protein, partial [Actinomycetota bacterium]